MRKIYPGMLVLAGLLYAQQSIYEQAAGFIQSSQPAEAIALLQSRLHDAPQDLKAMTLMGMALSSQNQREPANRYFQEALKVNPSYAPALKNLAINELAEGDAGKARFHLEELLKITPADPIAHLALADIDFAAKRYASALAHYDRSAELYLREPPSLLRFAQACVGAKQSARAVAALARLPADAAPAEHFAAGSIFAGIQEYAAAAHEFELAHSGAPGQYDPGFNLTLAYFNSGQYDAAVRSGQDLLAHGFRKAELLNLMAQAYEKQGKTGEAYDALRTAANLEPKDPSNYLDLIALCVTHKNFDLALEIAGIGVERLPTSDKLHLQRGIALAMKEQFEDARREFETAVKLAPDGSLGYVALSLMLLQMDRPAEAVSLLRKRAKTSGDYLTLWFLGESLNRAGLAEGSAEEQEATAALTRSVALNGSVAQPRILLAKLLARRGQLDLAGKHLTHALALEPDNVSAKYQLAQVCQKKGDTARARQLFAEVSRAKAEEREQLTRGGLQQILREGSR